MDDERQRGHVATLCSNAEGLSLEDVRAYRNRERGYPNHRGRYLNHERVSRNHRRRYFNHERVSRNHRRRYLNHERVYP
jgi:hypothetical protein